MNQKFFPLTKHAGLTLIEVLVSLLIFAFLMLGSGTLLSQSLKIQKEATVTQMITNIMEQRLQAAASSPAVQTCSSINLDNFTIGATVFYVGCDYRTVQVNSTTVSWPVLAVSQVSNATATTCAANNTTDTTSCYVVGK